MVNCFDKLIRVIHNTISRFYFVSKWSLQSVFIRKKITSHHSNNTTLNGRILILAPHSDDEWIGCSQLIKDNEIEIVICDMDMDGGDSKMLHVIRKDEMKKVSDLFSRQLVIFKGDQDKEKSLEGLLSFVSPQYVCLPFLIDWHNEHRRVMDILYNALNQEAFPDLKICMYQVSLPILPSMINYTIPMDYFSWNEKWNNFKKYYKSQIHIPYSRFSRNEIINGGLSNSYAAEVFSILTHKEWADMYLRTISKESVLEGLLCSINDLYSVRIQLEKLYSELSLSLQD